MRLQHAANDNKSKTRRRRGEERMMEEELMPELEEMVGREAGGVLSMRTIYSNAAPRGDSCLLGQASYGQGEPTAHQRESAQGR
jgi:hypothetical protein